MKSQPRFDCQVTKEDRFRSLPLVNKTDDMVRVTMVMTLNEWRRMQRHIETPKTFRVVQ